MDTTSDNGNVPASAQAAGSDVLRTAYVVLNSDYCEWVKELWRGSLPPAHALSPLARRVGEAGAWGEDPHLTLTDALTTRDAEAFVSVVRAVCAKMGSVDVTPRGLGLYSGDTSLVVECESETLGSLRLSLQKVTRLLTARSVLADEEWQRSLWWIERVGGENKTANLDAIGRARERYEQAGHPPLPSSRHFRLGRLVSLSRAVDLAPVGDRSRARRLADFLRSHGDPPWYGRPGGLHTTIASGLHPHEVDASGALRAQLWPEVQTRLPPFQVQEIAILGEGEELIETRFFDSLTETFVTEKRPQLVVVERISLDDH